MELRCSAAHVFVDPAGFEADAIPLDPPDAHHLGRVLRLRAGERVSVCDGNGRWRWAEWAGGPELTATGTVQVEPPAHPPITIGFTPVKGDRPEWTVQKLTELGVDQIVPLRAERSVVRWDSARAAGQLDRLRRVAREAAMQSRRTRLPQISEVSAVATVSGTLADFGGGPLTLAQPVVLVGPEGGWTAGEVAGRDVVSLGPTVLRAETAAVAAAAVLAALRSQRVVADEHGPWS